MLFGTHGPLVLASGPNSWVFLSEISFSSAFLKRGTFTSPCQHEVREAPTIDGTESKELSHISSNV